MQGSKKTSPIGEKTSFEGEAPSDVALAVRLADWLDGRFIDPIVGLILPGAGDLVFAIVGMYPVVVALRRRMPAIVAARMIRNLAVDLLFGAVPVVGDVFDFVFQAHRRNADLLLERHALGPSPLRDWGAVIGAALVLLVALSLPIVVVVMALARFG
ncbi:MAG: DUF4112 domain-containing protein [Polyangiaceae bacterium]